MLCTMAVIPNSSFLALLVFSIISQASKGFRLFSSSTISTNKETLHDYLATPTHWPRVVLSSHSVVSPSFAKNPINTPLQVGDYVEEIFGLPPILPLSVVWQCVTSDMNRGILEFYSKDGLPGFANECKMRFNIKETGTARCSVELTMEFESLNRIVPLAVPLLSIDNNFALKILLPKAMSK